VQQLIILSGGLSRTTFLGLPRGSRRRRHR
jgi:hypothetical protein